MAIQDEMLKAIEKEIEDTISAGRERVYVDKQKAKDVAQMLVALSVNPSDADELTNQYIAGIKHKC